MPRIFFAFSLSFLLLIAPLHANAQTATAPPAMVPNSFADLAERVQDAVVNLSTTQKIDAKSPQGRQVPPLQMPDLLPNSPFQDFFEEFFNNPNGMPQVPGGPMQGPGPRVQSLGSGFIIDAAKGLIVTNNHVIDDADEIKVILHDNTQLEAKILGRDTETDLALLQVKSKKPLTAVSWGNSDVMRVGDWILAVGNPFGLGGTVTTGIISARQRNINAGRYDDFIQTDAPINRGNSGGPMFNMRGEVIGINTAIFSPTGGSVGIGFAIPSNLAKSTIDQLITFGVTKRGWIGVRIQEVTPEIAESLGLTESKGALIASVTPDGPAAKAGIKQGDVIVKFGGKDVTEMRYLPRIVAETPIGQKTTVTVLRQGKEVEAAITPGQLETAKENGLLDEDRSGLEKSDQAPLNQTRIAALDLHVARLTPELRQRYSLADDVNGVVITDINNDSDASQKGLTPGDVILEVNQRTVKTPDDVQAALNVAKGEKKTSVLLFVNSQNTLRFVAVRLASEDKKKDAPSDVDKDE